MIFTFSDGEGQAIEGGDQADEQHINGDTDGGPSESRDVPAAPSTAAEGAARDTEEQTRERRRAEIETYRHLLGDIDIPDGVDVSFLAALPESMRQEVIEDHLRQQRVRRMRDQSQPVAPGGAQPAPAVPENADRAGTAAADVAASAPGGNEIAPEFLDALPPEIQEEVSVFTLVFLKGRKIGARLRRKWKLSVLVLLTIMHNWVNLNFWG